VYLFTCRTFDIFHLFTNHFFWWGPTQNCWEMNSEMQLSFSTPHLQMVDTFLPFLIQGTPSWVTLLSSQSNLEIFYCCFSSSRFIFVLKMGLAFGGLQVKKIKDSKLHDSCNKEAKTIGESTFKHRMTWWDVQDPIFGCGIANFWYFRTPQ